MKRIAIWILVLSLLLAAGCAGSAANEDSSAPAAESRAASATEPEQSSPEPASEEDPIRDLSTLLGEGRYAYTATWGGVHTVLVETFDEMGKGYNDITLYCIDLETGRELTATELLEKFGVKNKFEYVSKVREAALERFDQIYSRRGESPEDPESLQGDVSWARQWTEDNVGFQPAFVTEDGRLAAVVKIGALAGRGFSYDLVFPDLALTLPEPSAEPESQQVSAPEPVLPENREITPEIRRLLEAADLSADYLQGMNWGWARSGDVISVVVYHPANEWEPENRFTVYNWNPETNEHYTSIGRLLDHYGYLSQQRDLMEQAAEKAGAYFDAYYADRSPEEWDALYLHDARRWTLQQAGDPEVPVFVTEDGGFGVVAKIGKPEGRGFFYTLLYLTLDAG